MRTLSVIFTMASIPAIIMFAVVPFCAPATLFGIEVAMQVSDLNVGLLFILALSSMAVYGIALVGSHGLWLPSIVWFAVKTLAFAFFFIWIRDTCTRLRYDQLMHFG